MSYILDALRRLEQDKEKARMSANPIRTVLQGSGHREATPPVRSRVKALWPWLASGLVFVALAVAVTFWVARSTAPPAHHAGPTPDLVPPAQTARGPSADAGLSPWIDPEPPPAWQGREAATRPSVPRIAEPPIPPSPGRRAPVPSLPVIPPASPGPTPAAVKPAPPASAPEVTWVPEPDPLWEEASPRPPSGAPAGRGDALPAARAPSPPPAAVPRVSAGESGLRISAIVWSQDREKRFAIVNMKTVYEGESLEEGRVVEIGEDEVVFEKDGRRFAVGMGRR